MAVLRGKGSLKDHDLVVAVYDSSVSYNKETGERNAEFPTTYLHPESEAGRGQTQSALNSRKDPKSRSGYNNSAPYSASQMDKIREVAGDNQAPLLNKDNERVGSIYGVKADLTPASNGPGFAMNTKSLRPSDLSVQPEGNVSVIDKVVDNHMNAKSAKDAAAAENPQQDQQNQAQAPQAPAQEQAAEQEPQVG